MKLQKLLLACIMVTGLSFSSIIQAQTETIGIPPEEIEFINLLLHTPFTLIGISSGTTLSSQNGVTEDFREWRFDLATSGSLSINRLKVTVTYTMENNRFKEIKSVTTALSGFYWGLTWVTTGSSKNISPDRRQLHWTLNGELQLNTILTGVIGGNSNSFQGSIFLDQFGVTEDTTGGASLLGVIHR